MNQLQNTKYFSVTPPAAIVDNAAFTTAEIDTAGWDFCQIVCYLGATDIALTVLQVTETDTTGSGQVAITETVVGTAKNIDGAVSALPGAGDDNKFVIFDIDLRGRKRFLDLNVTMGDGSAGGFLAAWAVLSRGKEAPTSMAERGAVLVMRA
jgi:hypothetical protein